MKKSGLSIRYKILLLLTLLPLIILAVYLVLAINIFEEDKVAYVFETSSASARTLSSQATTDLNSILSSAKPVIQEFVSTREFGPVSRAIFQSDPQIEWVAAYQKTPEGPLQQLGISERLAGIGQRDLQSFGDLNPLLTEALSKGRILRVPFKDEKILIAERVGAETDEDAKVFLIFGKVQDLASSFRVPTGFESFLVNDAGFVFFGPSGTEASYLASKINTGFLTRAQQEGRVAGTEETKNQAGREVLASFAKTGFGDLAVVSVVEKKQALKAVEVLIRQSLLFFGVLICFSVIVSLLASGSLTATLSELSRATRRVAEGQFNIRVPIKSTDEVGMLATSFNAMAEEVSRLLMETAEKARMEGELKTAQTVQETLFPPTEATIGGLEIAGYYEPASECGGDWWHYCQIGSKTFLWIGDATGHGAPAALITSAAKSAATIIERLNIEPAHALQLLNRAIYDVSKGKIMMTFFLASFDSESGILTYANASHEAPYLLKFKEGELKKRDLIPLNEVNSPRLGQDRDTEYEQTEVKLDFKDRILFYTDGIPDIEDPDKVAWGEREFIKGILKANTDFPPISHSVHKLVELFSEHRARAPLKDDITFFMVDYTGT